MTETQQHNPFCHTKMLQPYVDDEGVEYPTREAFRYSCSCGWESNVWQTGFHRALGHFERHLEREKEAA